VLAGIDQSERDKERRDTKNGYFQVTADNHRGVRTRSNHDRGCVGILTASAAVVFAGYQTIGTTIPSPLGNIDVFL
jgi:hypothetical protein